MRKPKFLSFGIACALLALAFFVPEIALGDAGNFAGASDYGGSSGSGSSSSSDSDSSGWISVLVVMLLDALFEGPMTPGKIVVIVVIAAAIVGIYVKSKKSAKDGGDQASRTVAVQPAGAQATDASRLRDCRELTGFDPAFDPAKVEEKLANVYVKLQNAWTDGDLEPVRPYFEDALFAQFERQLNAIKAQGFVSHVDNVAVLECVVRGWYAREGEEYLVLKLRSRINDYTTDRTGVVVRGALDRELFMEYEYTLSRTAGTQTAAQAKDAAVNQCPNCAAPLNEGASARCPYCGSVIAIKQHDWVISSIKGISQQTA